MAYPMGASKLPALQVDFDRRLKLKFHGGRITSDAGLLAYRQLPILRNALQEHLRKAQADTAAFMEVAEAPFDLMCS